MEITSRQVRFLARMGSRGAFGDAIYQLAKQNKDFFALSADLGHASGYDRLIRDYPEKYINVGIAEQNLVGVLCTICKFQMCGSSKKLLGIYEIKCKNSWTRLRNDSSKIRCFTLWFGGYDFNASNSQCNSYIPF